MPSAVYPFDPSGQASTNVVGPETHPLVAANAGGYLNIVPFHGPFFENDLQVVHVGPVTTRTLVEGVDFHYSLKHLGLTRFCNGRSVWGGICMIDPAMTGNIRIDSYRTIGGDFTVHAQNLHEHLANLMINPRVVSFEQVAGVPAQLPGDPQDWNLPDTYGMKELVEAINALSWSIANKNNSLTHGGISITRADSDVVEGASPVHYEFQANERILKCGISLHIASTNGPVQVMPRKNGVDLLNQPLTIAQGALRAYTDQDPGIQIVSPNCTMYDRLTFEVLPGGAGVDARFIQFWLSTVGYDPVV